MSEWTDAASFATAGGTLVLALATFASVRVSNRAARTTERSLLAGMLPLLVPIVSTIPTKRFAFIDDHWIEVSGGHGVAEFSDNVIYLAIALRNVGQGLALLDRWSIDASGTLDGEPEHPDAFRRLTRDLYVASGDVGYWQGTLRDESDPLFSAVANRNPRAPQSHRRSALRRFRRRSANGQPLPVDTARQCSVVEHRLAALAARQTEPPMSGASARI